MEHVICQKCKSEYDLKVVKATGQPPHKTVCEVCGSILKNCEGDHQIIAVMTKYGSLTKSA